MTEEERADEYASSYGDDNIIDMGDAKVNLYPVRRWSFLAGLKAGKNMNVPTKWHDLRKDPNDLPKIEIGRTSITVLNEDGNKVYYDYYTKYWRYDDEELHITTPPIAWCEIPKFSE